MSAQITGTTGTFTKPAVTARREGGSTVVLGDQPHINILTGVMSGPAALGLGSGNMNLDSQLGIYTDQNGYQELNSFLAFWAAGAGTGASAPAVAMTGRDAAVQLSKMLADYIRNPEMRRLYSP